MTLLIRASVSSYVGTALLAACLPACLYGQVRSSTSMPRTASVISGRVLGSGGAPLVAAHVRLREVLSFDLDGAPEVARARVGPDGRFVLATTDTGAFLMDLMGADHETRLVMLRLVPESKIIVEARLRQTRYASQFDSVRVVGDFNDFRTDTSARRLERQRDGTYALDIAVRSDSLAYALWRATRGTTISGTQRDHLVLEPSAAGYRSVVPVRGGFARVIFDPTKLRFDTAAARVVLSGSAAARAASVGEEWQREIAAASATGRGAAPGGASPWPSLVTKFLSALKAEREPLVREAMLLQMLTMAQAGAALPADVGAMALREVPPGSAGWHTLSAMSGDLSGIARLVAEGLPTPKMGASLQIAPGDSASWHRAVERHLSRVDSMVDATANDGTRATYLVNALHLTSAFYPVRAAQYLSRMQAEWPDRRLTKMAVDRYGSTRLLRPGVIPPAFSVVALADTTKVMPVGAIPGKYVLIDFWATWCEPCVDQMVFMDEAYARFHEKGLEIVSISFDASPEVVAKFRAARWPMPWTHGWVPAAAMPALYEGLRLWALPRIVLLGPDGRIVAMDGDIRGAALLATLERLLK